jgi:sugar O-acyltransferase (sialic acid O-acetyltransferase NeuD family)
MSKVILFGAGRGAYVAHRYLTNENKHEIRGFTVDERYMQGDTYMDLPLVPFETVQQHFPPSEYKMFTLLSYDDMNGLRMNKYLQGKEKGYDFISCVSPSVHSPEALRVGENCFIMENQTINLDVTIGNNVVMWSGNHVGDNTVVEDHAWFCSHVCIGGDCTVGSRTFLGNNCTISNNVNIGARCYIGPNALIGSHVEAGGVYVVPPTERAALDSDRFMQLVHMHCMRR